MNPPAHGCRSEGTESLVASPTVTPLRQAGPASAHLPALSSRAWSGPQGHLSFAQGHLLRESRPLGQLREPSDVLQASWVQTSCSPQPEAAGGGGCTKAEASRLLPPVTRPHGGRLWQCWAEMPVSTGYGLGPRWRHLFIPGKAGVRGGARGLGGLVSPSSALPPQNCEQELGPCPSGPRLLQAGTVEGAILRAFSARGSERSGFSRACAPSPPGDSRSCILRARRSKRSEGRGGLLGGTVLIPCPPEGGRENTLEGLGWVPRTCVL